LPINKPRQPYFHSANSNAAAQPSQKFAPPGYRLGIYEHLLVSGLTGHSW